MLSIASLFFLVCVARVWPCGLLNACVAQLNVWAYLFVVAFVCCLLTWMYLSTMFLAVLMNACVCAHIHMHAGALLVFACACDEQQEWVARCCTVISITLTRETLCVEGPLNTLQGQTLSHNPVLLTIACLFPCNTPNANTPKSPWPKSPTQIWYRTQLPSAHLSAQSESYSNMSHCIHYLTNKSKQVIVRLQAIRVNKIILYNAKTPRLYRTSTYGTMWDRDSINIPKMYSGVKQ